MNSSKYHKAVFFDLDGLILDTEKLYCKLMVDYSKKINLDMTENYYINNLLGKTKNQITDILKEKYNDKFNEEYFWDGLLKYREEYIDNNEINVKEGFFELIDYLKRNDYYIGIVTSNSYLLVKKLLSKTKINLNDFNSIITREKVSKPKPSDELYQFAIKESLIDKEQIIVLEDSSVGLKSAISLDLNVIHVKDIEMINDELLSKCIASVKSLKEVITILEKWEG